MMLLVVTLLFTVSCGEKFDSDFDFAVIKTTGQKNKSFITYYDANMNEVYTQKLNYGGMTDNFELPIVQNRVVYMSPEGLATEADLCRTLGLDLKTGEVKEYRYNDEQIGITSTTVNSKATYVCSNLNGVSWLARSDKENKKIIDRSFKENLLWSVIADEDNIYGFANNDDDQLYIYEFNADTLETINKKNLKITGDMDSSMIYKGNIYFNVAVEGEENGDKFGKYNIKSKTISWIEIPGEMPISDIFEYKDKIYVIHNDSVISEGNDITIFDPATGEQELIKFEHPVVQVEIKNDIIYTIDDTTLYKYELKGNKVKLIDSKEVYARDGNSLIFYYLGSFFLNDK